jgi:hypothetical protein
MTRKTEPAYRRQRGKSGDRAFVELDGKRHYLGEYDSAESRARLHAILLEWHSGALHRDGRPSDLTVVEFCARFWTHAESYYRRRDGKPSGELSNFKTAIGTVRKRCFRHRVAAGDVANVQVESLQA